jgi:hypothetical protein
MDELLCGVLDVDRMTVIALTSDGEGGGAPGTSAYATWQAASVNGNPFFEHFQLKQSAYQSNTFRHDEPQYVALPAPQRHAYADLMRATADDKREDAIGSE